MTNNITDKQRPKQGRHPNSLANLRPFPKGNSANPAGRPRKDVSLTSLLKVEIEKIPAGEKQGRTWRQLLVLAWLTGAMKNPVLLKEVLDRLEGKVTQPVSGESGGPIEVKEIDAKGKLISIIASIVARDGEGESPQLTDGKGS